MTVTEMEISQPPEPEVEVVSNEDYQFANKLTAWTRMNLARPLLRILDEKSLLEPTAVQAATVPKGLNTKKDILGKSHAFLVQSNLLNSRRRNWQRKNICFWITPGAENSHVFGEVRRS